MKNHNSNFPDSLLHQFNFGATTIDTPAEENEDALVEGREEAIVENEREVYSNDEDQSTPNKEKGAKSETDSSLVEKEGEPEEPP